MELQVIMELQIPYDSDKIQLEGQENDLHYANQPAGVDYLSIQQQQQQYHQQFLPQNMLPIELAKQSFYNNPQACINHLTPANAPFVGQQVGLINNYETQANQIYSGNPFYQYQISEQTALPENITDTENVTFHNTQQIANYDNSILPAPPATQKTKKQKNPSNKNNANSLENKNVTSNTKKSKKGSKEIVLAENIIYNTTEKIEEDFQLQQLSNNNNNNIISKQDFQSLNSFKKSEKVPQENNLSIISNQIRVFQKQQLKGNCLENSIIQQGSQLNMKVASNKVISPSNLNENYSENDMNKYQTQKSNNSNDIPQNILIIQKSQLPQQSGDIGEEDEQIDQEINQIQKFNPVQQYAYAQNTQYLHGHGGIANQAYTFVSNEALGFQDKQEMEDVNFEEKNQEMYQIMNQVQLNEDNNQNISQYNYQADALQTPQQTTTKKKYSKKNNKTDNNSEAPPKKQREKKQSASDKSNATSSTSTTASLLIQNQMDQQNLQSIKKNSQNSDKINILNDNFNLLQNQQSTYHQEKTENIPPFQDEPLLQLQKELSSKPTKETKKRAQSKKKSKTSIVLSQPLDQQADKQSDQNMNLQQNNDQIIPNEDDQNISMKQQNLFEDTNLLQSLHKKLENQQFQQRQINQTWNETQFGGYQQADNNQQFYLQENLGLQQMDQGNIIKISNKSKSNEQMHNNIKFHLDKSNQGEYQMVITDQQQQQQQQHQQNILSQQQSNSIIQTESYTNKPKSKGKKKLSQELTQQRNQSLEIKISPKDRDENNQDEEEEIRDFRKKPQSERTIEEEEEMNDIALIGIEGQEDEDIDQLDQFEPEKLSKKKKGSSKQSSSKPINRKRKISSIHPEMINNENSNSDQENNNGKLRKEKSVNEKKRGIRDLTTDEKWDVFVQYDLLKSYRGVGRLFNMDHSTVKLLVQRINNERPGEKITKDIFLQSQIAQPSLEHSVSKKLKKEQKALQNANNNNNNNGSSQKISKTHSKMEKNSQDNTNSPQQNAIQDQEQFQGEEQIHLYDQENMNNQNNIEVQIKYEQENLNRQDSQLKIEAQEEIVAEEQQEQPLPETKKAKSRKESKSGSSRKQTVSKRKTSAVSKSQTEINQNGLIQQIGSEAQMIQQQFQYEQMAQTNNNQHIVNQTQIDLKQQEFSEQNEKMQEQQQNIKYEQEQYDNENEGYNLYQSNMQINQGGNNYQQDIQQSAENNESAIKQQSYQQQQQQLSQQQQQQQQQLQQQYNQQPLSKQLIDTQLNLYGDVHDNLKLSDNLDNSQLDIQQDQNAPPPMSETIVRSKSSSKMTKEEKSAKKELKKQFQEQQKARAKEEKQLKKKGKGKGQQDQQSVEMQNQQEYQVNDPQAYQQNFEQYIPFNQIAMQGGVQDNQYYFQNYDANIQYIPQGVPNIYQYNTYQPKYEEDYDINIDNLDINNYAHQQQQQHQNQQSYDDEIKLELL